MIWHYTSKRQLLDIVTSSEIRLATIGVPNGERPVAWFSSNPVWENTAGPMAIDYGRIIQLDRKRIHERFGLGRIGVAEETAPHNWEAFCRLSGASRKTINGLRKGAIEMGGRPSEWFVSFEAVPAAMWLSVEWWDGVAWVPLLPA